MTSVIIASMALGVFANLGVPGLSHQTAAVVFCVAQGLGESGSRFRTDYKKAGYQNLILYIGAASRDDDDVLVTNLAWL